MTFIDLTMPLNEQTPVYPGDPKVQLDIAAQLENDGYLDHLLHVGTHNGTHVDAPAHMIEGGKLLNQFPIDSFIGNGKLVDVRNGFSLNSLDKANIQAGDIVLFYTGTSDDYNSPAYYESHPVISEEAVNYVTDRKVKMVGIDTGSVDEEPFAVHKKLLSNNVLIIENLVNLNQLVTKTFTIYALPLNLSVEGSPARVVAVLA